MSLELYRKKRNNDFASKIENEYNQRKPRAQENCDGTCEKN